MKLVSVAGSNLPSNRDLGREQGVGCRVQGVDCWLLSVDCCLLLALLQARRAMSVIISVMCFILGCVFGVNIFADAKVVKIL